MSTVDDLQRKVQSLRGQLQQAEKSLHDAKCEELGLKPGIIVSHTKDGKLMKIVQVDFVCDKPWLWVNPQKKDGSFGDSLRRIYDDFARVNP